MSEFIYPEIANDPAGVKRILTYDMLYRRRKCWELIKFEKFKNFISTYNHCVQEPSHLLITYPPREYTHFNTELESDQEIYIAILLKHFKHLKFLNPSSKYFGKLAVCGGILTRILNKYTRRDGQNRDCLMMNTDADIFFYNTNEVEANEILVECVALIIFSAQEDSETKEIRYERQLNVTNVVIILYSNIQYTYQFIHRIYPTLNSIIGGFDLGPCMVAYDGKDILATPLGAWSLIKNAIIIDNSRRSTSFEHRLLKYVNIHDYALVFPGLRMVNDYFKPKDKSKVPRYTDCLERFITAPKGPEIRFTNFKLLCRSEYIDEIDSDDSDDDASIVHRYYVEKILTPLEKISSKTELLTQDLLTKYSDYSDSKCPTSHLPLANARMLKCNNISGVICYQNITRNADTLCFENSFEDIKIMINNMINNPFICIKDVNTLPKSWSTRAKVTTTAEFYPEFKRAGLATSPEFETRLNEKQKFFKDRIEQNHDIAIKELTGIKWITQNPQRQWTSSINPVIMNPREFYMNHYIPFPIGLKIEVEIALRLIRKRNTFLKFLNKDLFNVVMEKLFISTISKRRHKIFNKKP